MTKRLLHVLDTRGGPLSSALALLLLLALLAGPAGLGLAYGPVLLLLLLALLGLGVRALHVRANLLSRLRVDAPLLLLGGLLVAALALRLLHIPPSTPAPGTDEAHFVEAALRVIRAGNYIPASLRHPTLAVYVQLATSVLRFVSGASANLWTWPTELVPGHLYGWGRAVVALLGAATLAPVYWVAARRYGRRAGLLAALFLALLPMHVAASGTVSPEVLAALLALLTAGFSQLLLEKGSPRWALVAGACAGLALASHYAAALALVVPVLAAILRPVVPAADLSIRRRDPDQAGPVTRWHLALLALVAALLAFLVACPAALFKLDRLVSGLAEAKHAYFPAEGSAGTGLRYLLLEGLGIGPAILVLLGILVLLTVLRRQDGLLFVFPVATYLALLVPRARFSRDLVLLAPWLALLAAVGVDRLCAWLQQRWPDRPWVQRWLPWGLAIVSGGLFLLTPLTL